MKANKSPDDTEVTPSKKKLKQARLPFMLISDVSPKAEAPQSRKRKLSVPDVEPVTKVGKISKENDLTDDLVVISDDDSRESSTPQKVDKPHNPYVNLVDAAWKKKLQKGKTAKNAKQTSKKLAKGKNRGSKENITENSHDKESTDVEMVEVEVQIPKENPKKLNDSVNQNILNGNKEELDKGESDLKTDLTSDNKESEKSHVRKTRGGKPNNKRKSSPRNMSKKANTIFKKLPEKSIETSPTKTESLEETTPISKKSPKKSPSTVTSPSENPQVESEVISIDDLDNSSDVDKAEPTTTKGVHDIKQSSNIEHGKTVGQQETDDNIVTPKRSTRNNAKTEEINSNTSIISTASSKLDESMSSAPGTPKQNKSSANLDESMNESTANLSNLSATNLTPKQLQKKIESAKKKEEREKERLDREKKKQQEKDERARQRQEKEEQKKKEREEKEEAKKKEREEKEEQKKKEREDKEKQKELLKKEKEVKEEQKKKEKEDKEDQKRKEKEAREEEKRKKQEALDLEKQEQELKKKKAAEAFVNFFVPKQKIEKEQIGPVSKSSVLSSFAIKVDMRLAPAVRVDLSDVKRELLDKWLEEQNMSESYLKCLKEGTAKPLSSGKTWPMSDKDDDDEVMIVEDELPPIDSTGEIITCDSVPREKLRPKLLSFHENRRPPYWGTWRKKSTVVKPRAPFGQEKQLDYEVDSDDDWEEEQEGESLDGSACGSDEDAGADDYEIDNEVFVPHGYLSDEEATMEEEEDMLSLTPETQKARLKHLEDEFETELKKPTEKLKPRLYGLLWVDTNGGKPENCVDALWNYFTKFSMIMDDPTSLLHPANEPEEGEKKKVKKKKIVMDGEEQSPKTEKKKKTKSENKESKKPKPEPKKAVANQPGINSFLTKIKPT